MAVSVADFNCSCSEQIFQFKNSRSNVAQGAEVLEQHRDYRVMEYPPELQEQTSSSWWTKSAMEAEVAVGQGHVWSTPNSGHRHRNHRGPLGAISGLMHRSKMILFNHLVGEHLH
jgi:hypothetical protein